MKKTVLTLTALVAAASVYAQGTVNFNNATGTGSTGGAQYVSNIVDNVRVPAGAGYLVQLYYGAPGTAENALVAVETAPINFSAAGLFVGSTRTLLESVIGTANPASGSPGQVALLQVRAWSASLGADFATAEAAWRAGSGVLGRSAAFSVTTGNPALMPPGLPAPMNGFRGFFLVPVPEPSTIGLGIVGLAALAFLRRRK
jgi:hypothetical protein